MFGKRTAFVIGAGANWHYGYPTGEQLVLDVIKCTQRVEKYFKNRIRTGYNSGDTPQMLRAIPVNATDIWHAWRVGQQQCGELINRLQSVSPLVIDYFLGWNPTLADLGRTMIALAILERETRGAGRHNINPGGRSSHLAEGNRDNWIRFVVHQLLVECVDSSMLASNDVHFLTFNYDRSLERSLTSALLAVDFLKKEDVESFLARPRIVHLYGDLGSSALTTENLSALDVNFDHNIQAVGPNIVAANKVLDDCLAAGQNIRVIDPHTKDLGTEAAVACRLLDEKDCVYFLGFGFDENNLKRLGWPTERRPNQRIVFTNYENTMVVNKRVALGFGVPGFYKPNTYYLEKGTAPFEKSSRDCYDAIALDFGTLG